MEFYAAESKKKLNPFATPWMELECIMLSEISQELREVPYDLTFNWNIINRRKSKRNITRDIEVKKNLTLARGE